VTALGLTRSPFGRVSGGAAVEVFTLTNIHGLKVRATNFGARILSIRTPDRTGRLDDIVLGYDTLESYLTDQHYFGAVVGRVAGRIANARFRLDGQTCHLTANNEPHHLHGGARGFDRVVWQGRPVHGRHKVGVWLEYTSAEGEEGYPGTVHARVTYTLTDRNELAVEYHATSDRATPINLTQHSSFNLAGTGDVLDHRLQVDASYMIPVDENLIPTGTIEPVEGGPFDFRRPTRIGAGLVTGDQQLQRASGYDHDFVLNRTGDGLFRAAMLSEASSGRTVEVFTTEPGLHVYTGNFLGPAVIGKSGRASCRHGGLCLETQHFPDSPNQPAFPSIILRPNSVYRSTTVFAFGVRRE
jgi:aldose 1-epimerase